MHFLQILLASSSLMGLTLAAPPKAAPKAAPARPAAPVAAPAGRVTCHLQPYGVDKKAETVSFDLAAAAALAKRAPSGVVPTKGKTDNDPIVLASGFPHIFYNTEGLKWSKPECLKGSKIKTYEFPIMENGVDYKASVKPRADPGPCRIVYSQMDGTFCGVMCHKIRHPEQLKNLGDPLKEFNICK